MLGRPFVDLLAVESSVLEYRDHLPSNFVAPVGQIDDLALQCGISCVISFERSCGDARKGLDAEFAGRRIDLLVGLGQIGQRLAMAAQGVR